MKKAQFSIEFLFAMGVIVLLFLTILVFSFDRYKEIRETKEHLGINAECERISNILSFLNTAGDGGKIITKINYNLTIYNNSEIRVEPENISCFYIANIENNTYLTENQYIKIKNIKEEIIIENV